MKLRIYQIWFLILVAALPAFADPVTTERVTAQLVAEVDAIQPGEAFWTALHLKLKPHWHIYWRNPGDAGLPTTIEWELPEGFTAGEINWPYPEKIPFDMFMDYGYEDEVMLLVKLTPPSQLTPGRNVTFKARADWLICKDICVPEDVNLTLTLPVRAQRAINETWMRAFADARAQLPLAQSDWRVSAAREDTVVILQIIAPEWFEGTPGDIAFFPYDELVVDNGAPQKLTKTAAGYHLRVTLTPDRDTEPTRMVGVLVSENGWRGPDSERALEIDAAITGKLDAAPPGNITNRSGIDNIWIALAFAFVGGMILNLMPCVLPVLSLKILGFVQQAGEDRRKILKHGLMFTLGVLVSFWVLAGALLALRAGGEQLGWGFQLQSPAFIITLSIFIFLFGLNLFGVFEIGTSFAGVGQNASARGGELGSFMSGVTATVVATPCTAPFMGSALGYALSQPPYVSMAIFSMLGLGMAAPYMLLAASPGLLRFVPKPGPWMETLKQSMGFLLMATVIWLLFVLNGQAGSTGVFVVLLGLLVTSVAGWILGRWGGLMRRGAIRYTAQGVAVVLVAAALWVSIDQAPAVAPASPSAIAGAEHDGIRWQPFSPERVTELRRGNQPFFIDFTAAWCLSCQVNKRVAFKSDAVIAAFAEKGVTAVIADWTNKDENITRALADYGRNSVPLYVLYPGDGAAPVILPEIITPGIVLDALKTIN